MIDGAPQHRVRHRDRRQGKNRIRFHRSCSGNFLCAYLFPVEGVHDETTFRPFAYLSSDINMPQNVTKKSETLFLLYRWCINEAGMNHSSSPAGDLFQHRPKDECGVFAVYGHPQAAEITFFGLYALQHRGQESAGIVVAGDKERKFKCHHGMALVSQVFNEKELAKLPGTRSIG